MDKENIRKGSTRLRIIFGQAGSGKSTKLINMIKSGEIERPIVLCSKWMLVRTMKERLRNNGIFDCRVNTIQSITNNIDNAPSILAGVDTIVIDEFSQIDYNQLLLLVDSAEKLGIVEMFAAGDFLQNEPINGGSYSPMRHIIRKYLLGKTSNFFASLIREPIYEMMIKDKLKEIEVPKELNTIFNKIEVDVLNNNWRQNGNISIRGYVDIQSLLNTSFKDVKNYTLSYSKLKKAILLSNWQIIVADWHQMNIVNAFADSNDLFKDANNDDQFYIDARGFSDVNYRKYYKKIDGRYKIINGRDDVKVEMDTMVHIKPTYAIVADSAQGMEFENVLLFSMLDKDTRLGIKFSSWSNFSFNTLYMAATRHKNIVDICVDLNGWKDMRKTLDILPSARKDMLKEEWLEYCLTNAPNSKIGYYEYNRKSHFVRDKNSNRLYSIIGKNILIDTPGTEIRFSQNAKKDIELYSEVEFMRRWLSLHIEDEYASNIVTKHFGKNKGITKVLHKPNKSEKFIIDQGLNNIDFTLSVRKFKEKYNMTKKSVEAAIETYQNWI